MAVFLFRADASAAMGNGHIMRCLALAEALIEQGQSCHFAAATLTGPTEGRLRQAGIPCHRVDPAASLNTLGPLCRALSASAVILDGYHFPPGWRDPAAPFLVRFHDLPKEQPPDADIILDPACAGDPRSAPATLWLQGAPYILLRRELRLALARPKLALGARHAVLVSFGGTDPAGLTLPVTLALIRRWGDSVPIDIVLGGAVPDADQVARTLAIQAPQARLHRDPLEMGDLMRGAGLAVSAAGGTLGELAALGVPAIVAIVAENQRQGAAAAASSGFCTLIDATGPEGPEVLADAAARLWADTPTRQAMAACGPSLIDGQGAPRIAAILLQRINADLKRFE